MKYALMIYGTQAGYAAFSPEEFQTLVDRHDAWIAELRETGELVAAQGLEGEDQARSVRVRDGIPVVTDGPFVEAKEFLASFYIVECSAERAVELAAGLPEAEFSAVEVRPVYEGS
ncbi:YciI family protein [Herbidospora yilanensis]|uniref:YciI family protein n=1 Tax=Herbidospora yilanensis TaxID=354426 RepID=UPI0007852C76|nr:YciI family protein [Herbidospora yilanensis]